MLRTVACILREIFGEEDSYRIGGDEFVAFALDSTGTELNENMEQFVRQVEEAGYSVAVGTASHSAGGIDIDALVKKGGAADVSGQKQTLRTAAARHRRMSTAQGKLPQALCFFAPLYFFFPVVRGTIYCN